jgi:glutamate dehydrogenase (NAD(P)+)
VFEMAAIPAAWLYQPEWVQDLQQLFWEEEEVMRRNIISSTAPSRRWRARARADKISHRTAAMAIGGESPRRQEYAGFP